MTPLAGFSWKQVVGQVFAYGLFMAFIGIFAGSPTYRHLAPDLATIKVSLRHAGQILGECHQRTAEELASLPANMRAPLICPRERSALLLEMDLNGEQVMSETLPARGLHEDGRASTYRRLSIPTGVVTISVRMKDQIDSEVFQYEATRTLVLDSGENLVIDFNELTRSFEFIGGASNERTVLQNSLQDFETGHGQTQDDGKKDQAAVGQRLSTSLLDLPDDPVGEKVEPNGNQGE